MSIEFQHTRYFALRPGMRTIIRDDVRLWFQDERYFRGDKTHAYWRVRFFAHELDRYELPPA